MTPEDLYLFLALAAFTTIGVWMNIKAGNDPLKWVTLLVILSGVAGMAYLIAAALFA